MAVRLEAELREKLVPRRSTARGDAGRGRRSTSCPLAMGWHSGEAGRRGARPSDEHRRGERQPTARRATASHEARADPTQRALGLLVRREHSRKELTRKLTARGVERDDADAAVDKLEAAGLAERRRASPNAWSAAAPATGYGPVRIRAELGHAWPRPRGRRRRHGSGEGDWDAHRPRPGAPPLRRRRSAATASVRRKAADFLLRRGFDGAHVRAATRFDPDD